MLRRIGRAIRRCADGLDDWPSMNSSAASPVSHVTPVRRTAEQPARGNAWLPTGLEQLNDVVELQNENTSTLLPQGAICS